MYRFVWTVTRSLVGCVSTFSESLYLSPIKQNTRIFFLACETFLLSLVTVRVVIITICFYFIFPLLFRSLSFMNTPHKPDILPLCFCLRRVPAIKCISFGCFFHNPLQVLFNASRYLERGAFRCRLQPVLTVKICSIKERVLCRKIVELGWHYSTQPYIGSIKLDFRSFVPLLFIL